jgi:hypothetical protein
MRLQRSVSQLNGDVTAPKVVGNISFIHLKMPTQPEKFPRKEINSG